MVSLRRARTTGRILCYHSVGQKEYGVNDVPPRQFQNQIEWALERGYRFVPAAQIAATGGGPKDLAITFDDALKSLQAAAPILKSYSIPWSVFVVSEWSEHHEPWQREQVLSWHELEALVPFGAEIGSHSRTHPDFGQISPAQAVDELVGSRAKIAERLGIEVSSFAIPLGQSMNWTDQASLAAKEAGYDLVYAQAEETRPRDTIARTFVTHFDHEKIFGALLGGAFDRWEEWIWN